MVLIREINALKKCTFIEKNRKFCLVRVAQLEDIFDIDHLKMIRYISFKLIRRNTAN